jgi:hypothetical protein
MLSCSMIRRRSTPWLSLDSRFTSHDSRSPSAYAQQQPQPQSPHVFTSRFSGYPGVGGLPPSSAISVHGVCSDPVGALRSTRSFTSLGPFSTRYRPLTSKSRRIRTCEKHIPNPFGIRSFKTKNLKLFRMCSYKKTGVRVPRLRVGMTEGEERSLHCGRDDRFKM